jgi:hypothetical protein
MKVRNVEKFCFAVLDPPGTSQGLTLWAMPAPAGNGENSITCLMGSLS